jgi:hypothetical protein
MSRRARKNLIPTLNGLESRQLLTVISPLAFHRAGAAIQRANAAAFASVGSEVTPSLAAPARANTGTSNGVPLDPTTLTPAGLARARFVTHASGPYTLATPSLRGISKEIFYIGNVQSTQFLHGTMVMRIDIPSTPGTPITGVAALRDRNVNSTGNQVLLDLTGTATDAQGRPTQLSWTVNSNSGGSYVGSPGQGTVTITYQKNGHSKHSVGGATSVFKGLILTNSIGTNINFTLPKFN